MTRTPPHLATLVLLTALPVVTLNMFLPSLPAMTRALQATEARMAWVVSGYMVLTALMQLALGPLSDRIGRRPVILSALGVYTLASLGCVLARDANLFIAFRLLQGAIAAGTVLSAAIIRDLFDPRHAAGRMGTVSASMALAPMLGPTIGGFLDSVIGWRAIFGLYAALGAAGLVLCWLDLGETLKPGKRRLRAGDYGALLRSARFWAYTATGGLSLGSFYVFISGVSFVAVDYWHLSSLWIGLGTGSITAGFILGALITARMAPRLGLGPLIIAGRCVAVLGVGLGFLLFWGGATSPLVLFGCTLSAGFGNGLTVANAATGAVSVRPDLAGTASSLFGAFGMGMGAALTALTLQAVAAHPTPGLLLGVILTVLVLALAAGIAAVWLERRAGNAG